MNNGNTDQATKDVLLAAGAEVYHRHGDWIRRYLVNLKLLEVMNEKAEESGYYDKADMFAADLREDAADLLDVILGALGFDHNLDPF